MENTSRRSHTIDNVDVDVDVDLVVDTAGQPLATDTADSGLGRALGTFGSSCHPNVGRVYVHVHDYVHVHEPVEMCPPETFAASQLASAVLREPGSRRRAAKNSTSSDAARS